MSFFDFLLKFWWIELLVLGGIGYAAYAGYIEQGTGLLAAVASFIAFWALSRSGLE